MRSPEEIIVRLAASIYLKFHEKLNLSLDDCDQIINFIIGEHEDLVTIKDQDEVWNEAIDAVVNNVKVKTIVTGRIH
ncbi:hypothetical protein KAR91_25620 [Candidatus Pacearchaeota archaeon]|nr:hypothetical protein [Candidatus Pacearchaeota archaeon]